MKTILLVEDHHANLEIYRTILEHAGFAVIEAEDGAAALHLTRERRPDLVLLDISIPIIDGWEVVTLLKADAATRNIPIVPITAHAGDDDRERAARVGCEGYLCKPVAPRTVVEELSRILERSDQREGDEGSREDDARLPAWSRR